MFVDRLRNWAEARGYRVAVASERVLEVVRKKLEGRRESGLIETGFFKKNLSGFRYLDGCGIGAPRELVIVAVPSPVHVLPFMLGDKRIDGLIPPTYVKYRKNFEDVLADMKINALDGENETIGAEILSAPLKSLAVHMGLVSYGRNNITYAPRLGSGYQLCGYVVGTGDGSLSHAGGTGTGSKKKRRGWGNEAGKAQGESRGPDWRETVLDRCSSCRACIKACPTGAIREDRFLISSERCYTLFSESKDPMPEWVRPPKSMCLIGCMVCQEICPENKGLLRYEASGVEFTAQETEALLAMRRRLAAIGEVKKCDGGAGKGDEGEGEKEAEDKRAAAGAGNHHEPRDGGCERTALTSAREKFNRLGMSEDVEVIGRNLWFLLERRARLSKSRDIKSSGQKIRGHGN